MEFDIDSSTQTPFESSDPDENPIYVKLDTNTTPTEVEFSITGGQLYLDPELLDLDYLSLLELDGRASDDRPRYITNLKVSTKCTG